MRSVSGDVSLLQAFSCLYREYQLQLAMQHQAHETWETLCMTIVDYIACKAVHCTALFILSSNENLSHSHVHSSMNTHAATQCALNQTLVIGKTCHNAKPCAVIICYMHACNCRHLAQHAHLTFHIEQIKIRPYMYAGLHGDCCSRGPKLFT